jgi:peroxiredoxin
MSPPPRPDPDRGLIDWPQDPAGSLALMPMEPVAPSIGWGVLHLLYRVDRARAEQDPGAAKRIVDAVASLEADGHQALVFVVLGHKADLGVMAYGPDLARLHAFQQELLAGPLVPDDSFVSLTELSEYSATEDDEEARLRTEEGLTDPLEVAARLVVWRERIAHYRENRLHPQLPARKVIGFYPMSKRRQGEDNWYRLSFAARKELMAGHARIGRTYAGRVQQLITGSVGLDDWEWGVTLLADDPAVLKEIVYEMRFDPVSADYADFGPFVTGLLLEPAEALRRVGL